jgi:hypothetical protein
MFEENRCTRMRTQIIIQLVIQMKYHSSRSSAHTTQMEQIQNIFRTKREKFYIQIFLCLVEQQQRY